MSSNKRARVIGLFNLLFAAVYLGCAGLGIMSAPTLLSTSAAHPLAVALRVETVAGVAVNGLTLLGLVGGGLLLLQGRRLGRVLTLVTATLVLAFVVLDSGFVVYLFLTYPDTLPNALPGAGLSGILLGLWARGVYPTIAALALSIAPRRLELR